MGRIKSEEVSRSVEIALPHHPPQTTIVLVVQNRHSRPAYSCSRIRCPRRTADVKSENPKTVAVIVDR